MNVATTSCFSSCDGSEPKQSSITPICWELSIDSKLSSHLWVWLHTYADGYTRHGGVVVITRGGYTYAPRWSADMIID